MKKKISLFFILSLMLLLAFTPTSFASNTSEKKSLKATKSSIKEFDEISIQKNKSFDDDEEEYEYTVVIEDEVTESGVNGYNIEIDQEKESYTVEPMTMQEMSQLYDGDSDGAIDDLLQSNINSDNEYGINSSSKKSWFSVRATTRDPPSANLNYTYNKLTWTHNGSRSNKSAVTRTCKAYAPTVYKTNWYTSCCSKTAYSVIDGGRTVTSRVAGNYYNYDFGNKSRITRASHNLYIEGHRDGKSRYTTSLNKSGEYNSLLRFQVVTIIIGKISFF